MSSKNILCVVEGEATEPKILKKLNAEFIARNSDFISIGTNIYHMYHKYTKQREEVGDEIDMFIFLKQFDKDNVLKDKSKRDFRAIYLFMDLDRHEPSSIRYLDCVPEMLNLFNNETENGKLYISYPMVEAFKHPISDINHQISKIELGSKYKTHVSAICDKKLENYQHLSKDTISKYFLEHIKNTNYLINDNSSYPIIYESQFQEKFTQDIIYRNQLEKFISSKNEVLVLSPFALFLLEYLGKPLFKEWKAICENES